MKKSISQLAALLPDNLSEDTLTKIVGIIHDTIQGEVKERMKILEAKAVTSIRSNMDKVKQAALAELNEENQVFSDAAQFKKLKQLMGVKDALVTEAVKDPTLGELQKENKVLLEHLNTLAAEVARLQKVSKTYKKNLMLAESKLEEFEEELELIPENKEPFKSSEKAVVINENRETSIDLGGSNPFLTDEVVALMPK